LDTIRIGRAVRDLIVTGAALVVVAILTVGRCVVAVAGRIVPRCATCHLIPARAVGISRIVIVGSLIGAILVSGAGNRAITR